MLSRRCGLGPVHRHGVPQTAPLTDVISGEGAGAVVVIDDLHTPIRVDLLDGPAVTVFHKGPTGAGGQAAVVTSGEDPVPHPGLCPIGQGDRGADVDVTFVDAALLRQQIQRVHRTVGGSHHQHAIAPLEVLGPYLDHALMGVLGGAAVDPALGQIPFDITLIPQPERRSRFVFVGEAVELVEAAPKIGRASCRERV